MITFRCSCGKQLQVQEERAGSKVKCPECEEILRVPEAGGIQEKSGPASPPPKTRPKPMDDDDGIEDRPRRRPARTEDDEDDDRPRRRSGRYEDDDDDRAPRRRKEKGGNGLLIGLIVGGVLLLAGVGVALFFLLSSGENRVAQSRDRTILMNNLKQITLPMHSYTATLKRIPSPGLSKDPLPPGTKPLLSCRVAILP